MNNAVLDEARHLFSGEGNLSMAERAVSVVGGLALAAVAAKPRPNKVLSLVALVAGVALALRGASGHCAAKALLSEEDDRRSDGVPDRYRAEA